MTEPALDPARIAQLREHADGGVSPFDPMTVATAAMTMHRRPVAGWSGRPLMAVLLGLLVLAALAAAAVVGSRLLMSAPPALLPADRGVFTPGAPATAPRSEHTATLLPDGRVLVVGGYDAQGSAEIWDPTTETFGPTGPLGVPRYGHTAMLLRDGRVLVFGGRSDTSAGTIEAVEIWDPVDGRFSPAWPREGGPAPASATLLQDGRVLLVGGGSATVWDPTANVFEPTEAPRLVRGTRVTTLLADGRVLLIGWPGIRAAEVWDPSSGSIASTGSPVSGHTVVSAILLPDGRVLVVGGAGGRDNDPATLGDDVATVDVWDPDTGIFTAVGSSLDAQSGPTATLLLDGRVLLAGGGGSPHPNARGSKGLVGYGPTTAAGLWDPATASFSPTGPLGEARWNHTATLLQDGRVLVIGGATTESYELK